MLHRPIRIEEWLKIETGFLTQPAIENSCRLSNVVQAEADKMSLMHDPNTFLKTLDTGVFEDYD